MAIESSTQMADLIFSKELVIRPYRLAALIDGKGNEFFSDASTVQSLAPAIVSLEDGATLLRAMADLMTSVSQRITNARRESSKGL